MYFLFDRKIRYIGLAVIIFSAIFFIGLEAKAAVVDCECKINFIIDEKADTAFVTAGKDTCDFYFGTFDNSKKACTGIDLPFKGANSQVTDCSSITAEKVKKGYFGNSLGGLLMDESGMNRKVTFSVVSCKATSASTGTGDSSTGGSTAGSGMTSASLLAEAKKKMNPGSIKSPQQLIGYAIKFDMAVLGAIALGLYIWAGFLWMTSGGNSERRDKATKTLVWVTFGVMIMFASYLLMKFIFEQIILK